MLLWAGVSLDLSHGGLNPCNSPVLTMLWKIGRSDQWHLTFQQIRIGKSVVFCIIILCWLQSEAICNLQYMALGFGPHSFRAIQTLGIVI